MYDGKECVWAGEKGEKRKTTAAWKEIQHCQVKATVTGRIYFLAEGFPVSSVTQRRRKKHIILKNTIHENKTSRRGGSPQVQQPEDDPAFCCSPTLQQEMSLAQHKTAPDKILFPASLAGRCMSATANTSKPPSPTAGQVSAPGTWMCLPQAPH